MEVSHEYRIMNTQTYEHNPLSLFLFFLPQQEQTLKQALAKFLLI